MGRAPQPASRSRICEINQGQTYAMERPIPSTMRALELDNFGGDLRLAKKLVDRPDRGEVLIRMVAAPIGPGDFFSCAAIIATRNPLL